MLNPLNPILREGHKCFHDPEAEKIKIYLRALKRLNYKMRLENFERGVTLYNCVNIPIPLKKKPKRWLIPIHQLRSDVLTCHMINIYILLAERVSKITKFLCSFVMTCFCSITLNKTNFLIKITTVGIFIVRANKRPISLFITNR